MSNCSMTTDQKWDRLIKFLLHCEHFTQVQMPPECLKWLICWGYPLNPFLQVPHSKSFICLSPYSSLNSESTTCLLWLNSMGLQQLVNHSQKKSNEKPNFGSYTLYILYVFSVCSHGQPFAQNVLGRLLLFSVCLSFQRRIFFILMPFVRGIPHLQRF